jgi:hypothetical protein
MSDLPKAWGVLYAVPNPDGSAKLCENCAFFVEKEERCDIHDASLRVTAGMVCGYHVYGFRGTVQAPVDPKLSGLEDVSDIDGTTCGDCRFFQQGKGGKGLCHGVAKPSGYPPQPVDEMGCCARWERR